MCDRNLRTNVRRSLVFCAVVAFGLAPTLEQSHAAGQDLTYTTVTRGEFGGALGTLLRFVPGAHDPMRETVFMKGHLMRTDEGRTSTIMNFQEGLFTHLDHQERSYFSFNLAEMQAELAAALEGLELDQPEDAPAEEPEVTFDVRLSTERTGRRMSFDGYSAEQVLMVVEVVPRSTDPAAPPEEAGSMVLFNEVWLSTDFPNLSAIWEAQMAAGQEMIEGIQGGFTAALQQAFTSDPRMEEAFERGAQELQEMEGMPVRTVSSFVILAPGAQLDRDAVLAAVDQPLSAGTGEVVAEGAQEAARAAVRSLTRGVLGRRQQEEAPAEEEVGPPQTIVMRTTSVVEEVRTDTLSPDLFRPPADYTERRPDWH